jgi:glutaredoxin
MIPFILISLYFQKYIEKKWCPICLLIILLISIELCYLYPIGYNYIFKNIILSNFIFFTVFYIWKELKLLITTQKDLKEFQLKSHRFQRNYSVFKNTLLSKSKIELPNTPIILGNQNSKTTITIITSPFCGHCIKIHEIIDRIIIKNYAKLKIQIIIKANFDHESEDGKQFLRSLFNIYFEQGEKSFSYKLKEWFGNKNIEEWLENYKYESNNTIKIDAFYNDLSNWCIENNYNYTPAIFINGFEYPNVYEREQIEFFINDIIEDKYFN